MKVRLSLKLFLVLTIVGGATFVFSPDALAHKNTGSVSLVQGTVSWPQGPKHPNFDVVTPGGRTVLIPANPTGLSLDVRTGTNSPLNGCRGAGTGANAGGNDGNGLPVGNTGKITPPTPPTLYTTGDLCFTFTGLQFQTVGLWDGLAHKTLFDCTATGTTGASGNKQRTSDTPSGLTGPTFGAFYGEFGCDGGALVNPNPLNFQYVPTADGHFNGLSVGSTTIGLLGEVNCTYARGTPVTPNVGAAQPCPLQNEANLTRLAKGGSQSPSPLNTADDNVSRIKHTLACKGEVVPLLPPLGTKINKYPDGGNPITQTLGDTVSAAKVTLVCIIA